MIYPKFSYLLAGLLVHKISKFYRFYMGPREVQERPTNDKSKYALFGCANPKKVFESVVTRLGEEEETAALVCAQGHRLTDKLLKTMAGALFNAFTSNYSRDVNSIIHRKKKVIVSAGSTPSQCFDRRMKMTGEKK